MAPQHFYHQDSCIISWEINENEEKSSCSAKESENIPFVWNPHRKLTESREPSSVQVSWKFV